MVRRWMLLVAVVGCACAAACGSTSNIVAATGRIDATILGMLRMVPAGTDTATVNLYLAAAAQTGVTPGDFVALNEHAGLPGSDLTDQLSGNGTFGIDLAAVRADVSAGDPPNDLTAALGHFDNTAIGHAADANQAWRSALTTTQYDGATVYRWLKDNAFDMTRGDTGIFSDVPQSRRLAVSNGDTVILTRNDPTLHQALDTTTGKADSLATNQDASAIATELDHLHAYAATITTRQPSVSTVAGRNATPSEIAAIQRKLAGQLLRPVRMSGIGVAWVHGKPAMLVVLANQDDATAEANAHALMATVQHGNSLRTNQPWSDMLTVDDVHADGTLTVATLTETHGASLWVQIVLDGDSLLMHS